MIACNTVHGHRFKIYTDGQLLLGFAEHHTEISFGSVLHFT